jgi:hypothetical protein
MPGNSRRAAPAPVLPSCEGIWDGQLFIIIRIIRIFRIIYHAEKVFPIQPDGSRIRPRSSVVFSALRPSQPDPGVPLVIEKTREETRISR